MPSVRLNSCAKGVTTLGPAPAVGLWVQGCQIGCRECMSPETWDSAHGVLADVADVARWMCSTPLRNLVISGGEPFDQAAALVALIDLASAARDWVVTCYSGYYRRAIERGIRPGSGELLSRLDLLIDGPYLPERHAPLLWRGSTNQSLHRLTDRVVLPPDVPAGVSIDFAPDGAFEVVGVPPARGFRSQFDQAVAGDVVPVALPTRGLSFPFPVLETS